MDQGILAMIMQALQQHQQQQAQQTPMFTEMGQDTPMMPNEGGGAGGPYDDDYDDPRFGGSPLQPGQDPLTGQPDGGGAPGGDMQLEQEPGDLWGQGAPQQPGGPLEAMFRSPAAGGRMSTK